MTTAEQVIKANQAFVEAMREANSIAAGGIISPSDAWSRGFQMAQSVEVTGLHEDHLKSIFSKLSDAEHAYYSTFEAFEKVGGKFDGAFNGVTL